MTRLLALPLHVARAGHRVGGRAVANARRGAAQLARQNADRLALSPAPPDAERLVPGQLQRLSRERCIEMLASRSIGRFAHVESARALDVVPVNYLSWPDGRVMFRSGPGPKLSSADRGDVVAFEVDDIDEVSHTGWSILVVGRARRLGASEASSLLHRVTPWASGPREHIVVIEPTRIEGRRLP